MRFKNTSIAIVAGLFATTASYAQQDLIQRVPQNSSFVAIINSPAIMEQSSPEKINQVLDKAGLFDELREDGIDLDDITDLDVAYDRNAYVYQTNTDSTSYVGILLPLKSSNQLEQQLLKEINPLADIRGYHRGVSKDNKTHVAWDENSLLILNANVNAAFFERDSVAARYGIEKLDYSYSGYLGSTNTDYADSYDTVDTTTEETAVATDAAADALALTDSLDTTFPPPAPPVAQSQDPEIDTTYGDDSYETYYDGIYSDSTYEKNQAIRTKNDSIKQAALATWVADDFERYLLPEHNASQHRYLHKFDRKNTLVHFWAKDLGPLYSQSLAYSPIEYMRYGSSMANLIYAYQDIVVDLVQDEHRLKLQAAVGVDKEMERLIKPIYKNRMNRKFANYIPQDHIGFLSTNFNSRAYLESLPKVVRQYYGTMAYMDIGDLMDIVGTVLEIGLDEKAIAKVMGGDHLVFINELKKVKKEYIDYEYDQETFDYNKVTKTKDDYIPTFLWMFTSEDQRIYQKILDLGMAKEKVTLTNGIYAITDKPQSEIIYTLFKDNIVFVSNDEEQLRAIHENRFQRHANSRQIKKQIYGNTVAAVTHLPEIPKTMNRLGIPAVKGWDNMLKDLSQYGDITISSAGIKRGRITAEISVDFPKEETNALQYLLQQLFENLPTKK